MARTAKKTPARKMAKPARQLRKAVGKVAETPTKRSRSGGRETSAGARSERAASVGRATGKKRLDGAKVLETLVDMEGLVERVRAATDAGRPYKFTRQDTGIVRRVRQLAAAARQRLERSGKTSDFSTGPGRDTAGAAERQV